MAPFLRPAGVLEAGHGLVSISSQKSSGPQCRPVARQLTLPSPDSCELAPPMRARSVGNVPLPIPSKVHRLAAALAAERTRGIAEKIERLRRANIRRLRRGRSSV